MDSLFTNVTLDEIIDVCVKELFRTSQTVSGLNKEQVLEMFSLITKESIILFDDDYYSQIDGEAMTSSSGPSFENIFLCHQETESLKTAPKPSNHSIIKDTLMTFSHCLKNKNKCYLSLII